MSRTYSAICRGRSSISAEEEVEEMERLRREGMHKSSLLLRVKAARVRARGEGITRRMCAGRAAVGERASAAGMAISMVGNSGRWVGDLLRLSPPVFFSAASSTWLWFLAWWWKGWVLSLAAVPFSSCLPEPVSPLLLLGWIASSSCWCCW